jgi:hypothetical protein
VSFWKTQDINRVGFIGVSASRRSRTALFIRGGPRLRDLRSNGSTWCRDYVFDIDGIIDYPCFSSVSALVQHAGRHGETIIYIKKTDIAVTTEFMESDKYLEDMRRVPDLDVESDADPTRERGLRHGGNIGPGRQ